MRRVVWITAIFALCGCPSDEDPEPTDMGGSLDQFIIDPDMPPPREWTSIRVDDDTPTGQGLALDHAEVCDQLGMACVALVVGSSSDDALDYAGAADGPNSQDDTCSDTTFTRLGGTGNFVTFAHSDGEAFTPGAKINVWTGDSACPLIEMGDKAFTVTFVDADGDGPSESCTGTCTVSAPQR